MHEIIKTDKPAVSNPVNCIHFTHLTVQVAATSEDQTQNIIANTVLEGSLDGTGWFPIADLKCDGSGGYATDGGAFETLWSYVRANVKSMSGNTTVTVYLAKRG